MSIFNQFYRVLFGYDFFISYSRKDGSTLASKLGSVVMDNNYSCFIDQYGSEPSKELPTSLKNILKNSSILIVLGTPSSFSSQHVAEEIEIFLNTKRKILLINTGKIENALWYDKVKGLPVMNLKSDSFDGILPVILNAFKHFKQTIRIRNSAIGALALISIALIFIVISTKEANENFRLAEENRIKANDYLTVADQREKNSLILLDSIENQIQNAYSQPNIREMTNKGEPLVIHLKNDRMVLSSEGKILLDSLLSNVDLNSQEFQINGYASKYYWGKESVEDDNYNAFNLIQRSEIYNERISTKFCKVIVEYMILKGVSPVNIHSKGCGRQNQKYELDFMNNRAEISLQIF